MRHTQQASSPIPYRPLPVVLAAAILGILADKLTVLPAAVWASLFCVFLFSWFIAYKKERAAVSTLLLLAACFSFFGLYHHYRWNGFAENEIGFYAVREGSPAAVQGTVIEMPRYRPCPPQDARRFFPVSERTFFTLKAARIRDGADWISVSGKVSVIVDDDAQHLHIGDSVQIFGSLARPMNPQNPGDYDYAAALRSYGILCVLRCPSAQSISLQKEGRFGLLRFFETIRRTGAAHLQQNMSSQTVPLATAMLLGIREGVDEETTQELIETGTLHLLAISGLHIGLLAVCVAFFLRLFNVSRRTTALVLIVSIIGYLLLTDVRPPAIRATVLVAIAAAALFSGRKSQPLNAFAATALAILLINPSELFHFGTQLSFIAVSGFFWVPTLNVFQRTGFFNDTADTADATELKTFEVCESRRWKWLVCLQRIALNVLQLFEASFIIWLVTMPLLLANVHLFTPIALLVNPLLWIPLTAAMLCGFATMLLGSIPFIGDVFGIAASTSFQCLFGMIAFFRDWGGHYWVPGPPGWWNLVFYTAFIVLTFIPVRKFPRRYLWVALGIGLAAGFTVHFAEQWVRQQNERLTLSLFSVGHGNASLIVTPENKTVIYDVGCISSPDKAADVMSNALWRLGKTKIDTVILSHPDSDHINGIFLLAKRFTIGAILVSPYFFEPLRRMEKELQRRKMTNEQLEGSEFQDGKLLKLFQELITLQKIPVYEVEQGDNLERYGLSKSTVLHPPKQGFQEPNAANAACLVLHFEHHQTGVLLTGDLDSTQRLSFLKQEPVRCTVMTVPHHGGKSNQTDALLKWAKPDLLLISAGRLTHRDSVIDTFRQNGCAVRSTFLEGAIILSF